MKTRKCAWILLAGSLCLGLTACAKEEVTVEPVTAKIAAEETPITTATPTETPTEAPTPEVTETPTPTPTEEPKETYKKIGTVSEKILLSCKIENATTAGISALRVKHSTEAEYGENLLPEGDVFVAQEVRMLYVPEEEAVEGNDSAVTDATASSDVDVISVELTYEDGVVHELRHFPIRDVEEIILHRNADFSYCTVHLQGVEEESSTEEAEKASWEEAQAALVTTDATTQNMPVANEPAAQEIPQQAASPETPEEPVSEEPAVEPVSETPVTEEPAAEPAPQETYTEPIAEPAPVEEAADPNEGCLGDDALTW